MKSKQFLSFIIVLVLLSCKSNRTQNKQNPETPKALQENSSYEIASKRSYEDLVESLYKEILSKDISLKQLEDKINELNKSQSDSTESFDKFNDKNQAYFSAADKHVEEITDSIVKNKIKQLLATQLSKYNTSIAKHTELLKLIEAKQMTISDLHNVLKIVKTLPLIEKYQKENLPSSKPFDGYIKHQEEVIQLADSLSKK